MTQPVNFVNDFCEVLCYDNNRRCKPCADDPRGLARGSFDPRCIPRPRGAFVPPCWNPQSRGLSLPMHPGPGNNEHTRMREMFFIPAKGDFILPWKPMTAGCSGHNQRAPRCGYLALWKPDRGLRTPAPRQAFRACNRPRRCLGTLHYRRAGGDRK
jgi:hypothetical protein